MLRVRQATNKQQSKRLPLSSDLDGRFMVFNLSLQTFVFLTQVLHPGQVTAVVIGSNQQFLLPGHRQTNSKVLVFHTHLTRMVTSRQTQMQAHTQIGLYTASSKFRHTHTHTHTHKRTNAITNQTLSMVLIRLDSKTSMTFSLLTE